MRKMIIADIIDLRPLRAMQAYRIGMDVWTAAQERKNAKERQKEKRKADQQEFVQ